MKLKIFYLNARYSFLLFLIFLMSAFQDSLGQEPLTLERSLEIAMKNSPEIKRYQLILERRTELLNAQNANLKSQFSLALTPISYEIGKKFGSYYSPVLNEYFSTWYNSESKQSSGVFTISQPIKWTDGNLSLINMLRFDDNYDEVPSVEKVSKITSKSYTNNLYLNFRQPIFTYNRTKVALRGLELDLENAALDYAIQKLYLEYQVTQNFFNIYRQKANLEIAKDDFRNRELSYSIIKNKVDAGLNPREELYQAELDLIQSNSDVQNAQVTLENYLDAFKKLIGLPLFDDITVTADISHQPVEVDLQKALDNSLKYRMELRQREIDIEFARYELIRAAATNEFKGDVTLSYGIIGNEKTFKHIYETPTRNQEVSLNLNIPLFDWGAKKSRIKAERATIANSELSLDDQKNDIRIEIRRAYRNLKNLVNQIEIAEQSVRNAQLTYDINLERYKNGDLTSMDLNLIQNQLSASKLNKISALINYKIETLNMKVLSLWDFVKNQRVVPEGIE
jgi:outer membrane protein TolC